MWVLAQRAPHVWSVAADALGALEASGGAQPQTIVASGVSGAGKSYTCQVRTAPYLTHLRFSLG